ncbi:hypothetical protein RUM43_007098 [Polyplax serrata]|uniref:Uncharacterized protein n=1 Tax=Polyplax serrata TaxID=468196 RepID=A0AAN8P1E2_POLSC
MGERSRAHAEKVLKLIEIKMRVFEFGELMIENRGGKLELQSKGSIDKKIKGTETELNEKVREKESAISLATANSPYLFGITSGSVSSVILWSPDDEFAGFNGSVGLQGLVSSITSETNTTACFDMGLLNRLLR